MSTTTPPKPPHQAEPRVLRDGSKLIGINLNYLIPNDASPCTIFLYQEGVFVEFFKKGDPVTIETFFKLKTDFFASGFIETQEKPSWTQWKMARHPQLAEVDTIDLEGGQAPAEEIRVLQRTKAAYQDFQSYALGKIEYRAITENQEKLALKAKAAFKAACSSQMISWYFARSQDEALSNHSARVTYLSLLFASLSLPPPPPGFLELLGISCIIHEIDPDLSQSRAKGTTPTLTLEFIQKHQHPLPQKIVEIIAQQEEAFDGSGAPRQLKGKEIGIFSRIFSLVNTYDHLHITHRGGTRKIRFERVRTMMTKNQSQYDPGLWTHFWTFLEKTEITE